MQEPGGRGGLNGSSRQRHWALLMMSRRSSSPNPRSTGSVAELARLVPWATHGSAAAASVGPVETLLPELLLTYPAALRAWLEEHHATSPGVRLELIKKGGSDTTITWVSAVEELLCFGWIDGQAGKRDEGNYTVRITPRRPKGSWSRRNVALVAMLEEQGRMTDAGRKPRLRPRAPTGGGTRRTPVRRPARRPTTWPWRSRRSRTLKRCSTCSRAPTGSR